MHMIAKYRTLCYSRPDLKSACNHGARLNPLVKVFSSGFLLFLSLVGYSATALDSQERSIVVSVQDHDGNIVPALTPSSFQAGFHKQTLRIVSATRSMSSRRVVILLDLSGSAEKSAELARVVAGNFAVSVQPVKPRIALVLFSGRIIDSLDFTHSPSEIINKLTHLPPGKGTTALLDSIDYAAGLFQRSEPGDAIYLISDGGDNYSKLHVGSLEKKLLANGIRLFAFYTQGKLTPESEEDRQGAALLASLTEITGGTIVNLDVDSSSASRERLKTALQRLYQVMADFYEVKIEVPPNAIRKEISWELHVLDERGNKMKDIKLLYPKRLVPSGDITHND